MTWKITYFDETVEKAIEEWPANMSAKYLKMVDLIEEFGPRQLGSNMTKAMGEGLFEIRIKASEGIGRAFYCYMVREEIVVLHSIIKKTQKTPKKELEIARKRMKKVTL